MREMLKPMIDPLVPRTRQLDLFEAALCRPEPHRRGPPAGGLHVLLAYHAGGRGGAVWGSAAVIEPR